MTELATDSLEGRIALVTGGSRGIGRAIALELGRRGASVAVNYHGSADAAQEVVETIEAAGTKAQAFQANISDFEEGQNLVKTVIIEMGGLDILVNNAGIIRDNLIMMMKESDWDDVLDTNLKGTFTCSKTAVRHMMRKRYGRVVNITSVAGQMGNPGQSNYSASKAGQIGFTKALAREVAPRKITVNAVAPGYVETDIFESVPDEAKEALMGMIPLARTAQAEEIGYAVAFLCSDQAAYITGQVLAVDGGIAMM